MYSDNIVGIVTDSHTSLLVATMFPDGSLYSPSNGIAPVASLGMYVLLGSYLFADNIALYKAAFSCFAINVKRNGGIKDVKL